jgi:hypothetical protein
VQFKVEPFHRKFGLQRHLFPSIVILQVEFGQSLQSLDEVQLGSCGGAQLTSTSASTITLSMSERGIFQGLLSLNGNDKLSVRVPPEFLSYLTELTNVRALGSILVTR